MDFISYFRWILFLPIVLGLLFAIFPAPLLVTNVLTLAAVMAGIPYTIFCILILWFTKNWSPHRLKKLTWLLPILFVPLSFGGFLIVSGGTGSTSLFNTFVFLAIYTLVVGYFYVISCWLIYALLSFFKNLCAAA